MKKWINWVWDYVFCPVWSFMINCSYWVINISDLKETVNKKKQISDKINSIGDIKIFIFDFKWTEDKYKDWKPWIITLIHKNYSDDCDGAATVGKHLFSLLKMKSKIYSLKNDKSGHAVCITEDKQYMISNSSLYKFTTNDWEKEMFKYFNNKYTYYI